MQDIPIYVDHHSTRFIDRLRLCIRSRNLAYATEKTYVTWALQFIRFHRKQHPKDMGTNEIESFLSYLATQKNCSKSTQRTVLNTLVFLYEKFLNKAIGKLEFIFSRTEHKLPQVFQKNALAIVHKLCNN